MNGLNDSSQRKEIGVGEYTLPPILRTLMLHGNCVAYVGAGFSMAAGMPGWAELLAKLVEHLEQYGPEANLAHARQALTLKDLPMAANIIRNLMNRAQINKSLNDVFGMAAFHRATHTQKEQMNERLKKLLGGKWAGIVTTNYDLLIEQAFLKDPDTSWHPDIQIDGDASRFSEVLVRAQDAQTFFVKLHGSITGQDLVLTTEEYDNAYLRTPQISTFLQALMLQYHLIFIGCSLEDEIVRIRRRLNKDFRGSIPAAYALMPKNPQNETKSLFLTTAANIQPIWYPSTAEDKDHKGLDDLLGQFASIDVAEDIRNLIRFPNLNDRFSRVSPTNKKLLGHIAEKNTRSIDLTTLIDEIQFDQKLRDKIGLRGDLEEEVKYRLLFLMAIGLLSQRKSSAGPIFTIPTRLTDKELRNRGISFTSAGDRQPGE
jgi:hypothetical protein